MSEYLQPRDLGDGLVLRWSTEADIERIAELASNVFRDTAVEPPNPRIAAWMRDLGSNRHPLSSVDRGVFVEDTRTGKVIASMWLIDQRWRFGDRSFGVGRPEAVASDPEYRRRGLVRALFKAFHARSAAEGQLAQAITGIPYYYRQFGYEFALDLGGSRRVAFADIPPLKEGEQEPYTLRAATTGDLPFVMELYERDRGHSLVSTEIPAAYWQWNLDGIDHGSGEGWNTLVIVDGAGASCGYVLVRSMRWGDTLVVRNVGVEQGVSLQAVVRPLLRALQAYAPTVPHGRENKPADRIAFGFGASHPLYDVLGEALAPRQIKPYGWYVRVPDLPGFIRYVAPVLEDRLRHSPLDGHTGELRLDFYRGGLRMVFQDGRLATVEHWERPTWGGDTNGGFPPLVFLQLLFGRRGLDDLRYALPDVWASDEAEPLLNTLFPRLNSYVMELD